MIALPQNQKEYLQLPKIEIDEIERLFVKAEQKIKTIEHCGDGLDIPSINELRYVARHLLTALQKSNLEELTKAKNHVKRALYDACEVLIISNLEEIKQFQNDYRLIAVTDVIKNYAELMSSAEEARSFIQETEEGSREDYYDKCSELVETLKRINTTLNAARSDLNVKISDRRTTTTRWFIGIGITLLIAIIGATVTYLVKAPKQQMPEIKTLQKDATH
ncbi:hypothetical protein H8K33_12355 [Undibacterium amnicola]|uniref:Uncharacterized protein n=2 Tax=Undibacterium amnicola TaxID=1834038 RepID=A0ABR6XS85_9BURK|nr:hypothetical protein [Undibacterium amnicola]